MTPVLASVVCTAKVRVESPATAAGLPFRVTVQEVWPVGKIWAGPIEEVIPAGKGADRLRLATEGLAGPFAPPTGVDLITREVESAECIVTRAGADIAIPGTWRINFWFALISVPAAVTIKYDQLGGAEVAAESVRVLTAVLEASVTGLLLQLAVTPVGSPEMLGVIGPLNDPPPVKVKTSVMVWPGTIVS